jgi:hypothetical protein
LQRGHIFQGEEENEDERVKAMKGWESKEVGEEACVVLVYADRTLESADSAMSASGSAGWSKG